jgi:hypothetical protein
MGNEIKLEKLPEKYCIRNEEYHRKNHPLHEVWKMYINKHVPRSNGDGKNSYYMNNNDWSLHKPIDYVQISLENWDRLSNLVVKAEDTPRPALTELPKHYAIQYTPDSFSEKEKTLWREYVNFVNLKAITKIVGNGRDKFYYNHGDYDTALFLKPGCTIITLNVWDRLRNKEPTIKQVLNIQSELSVEEFLSLSEQDRLAHLEWKYPPGTCCISRKGIKFFVSANPVEIYADDPKYGRFDDYGYLFSRNNFTEIFSKSSIQESTPTKKDLSSIKTKEEAYDYLISIGVKPGMEYTNTHGKGRYEIPENFLNKKEILYINNNVNALDPGFEKGYYLWLEHHGFLTDFDDIDMYGNPKTQKVNGEKPVIPVIEEACIDNSLLPVISITDQSSKSVIKEFKEKGFLAIDPTVCVGDHPKEKEIRIKTFNVPKI